MGFTLLSDCSFQIGLDSSDFSCLFQAQETKGGTKCTELGSFSRRSTKYPVLLSFSTLSIKQNRLAVAERNLMEFVKPAVSCPIECNRLLVCVRISCGFRRACPRATASRLSARSGVRMARALWQQACPLASCKQFSRELLQADCALRRRPPPAPLGLWRAAAAVVLVACSLSSSLCCPTQSHSDRHWQPRRLRRQIPDGPEYLCRSWPTDYHSKESQIIMSGKIGLGRHFRHTINQNILVRFQQTLASLEQWSR
jgi:hypothetical protein